ncbi:vacuolar protein sorting-associated protein 37B-like [Uloborus diversus]|uniref:vacuolar protein sorting-associated protein 37B-like n=1 Tax=Uloborus diversus TaxID=327109 RepID=UPI002409AA30|nr:vacuolar protein sorting-associated protein 37B-like [Uloborus diversus]
MTRNMNSATHTLFTPDYSHLTGFIKHLNADELKDILNNDEKSEDIIKDLKQVKDIEAEREMLIASNRSISEYNLSKKDIIQEQKKELDESYQRALELKTLLLKSKSQIESKIGVQSEETILALLQAATSEIDEEAEATVDVFLKGEITVEDFLEKYLELRKLAHLRRIKSEKLAKLLQDGGNITSTPPTRPNRHRKAPPPPPVSNNFVPPNSNFSPNQNNSFMPMRQAPYPPAPPQIPSAHNVPYFGAQAATPFPAQTAPYPAMYPNPSASFSYCSPYPRHPAVPNLRYPQHK